MYRTSTQLAAAAALIAVALDTTAFAQGAMEQQNACRPDVFRLCSSFIPDVGEIVACLPGNEMRLSEPCHQVMFGGRAQSERYATPARVRSNRNQ
jgi:hypothetical protein